jgi:hypothetical protein
MVLAVRKRTYYETSIFCAFHSHRLPPVMHIDFFLNLSYFQCLGVGYQQKKG